MKFNLSMKTDKQRRMIDIMNDSRTQGHKVSQGNCSATTGDGSLVVGSPDGKIRLYPTTSSRQAKTAFPGFGSPITHVDVTHDGKWILGTTDTYLILLSTLFIDKDGKIKSGFTDRMGTKIPAPTLLKLTPVHSHMTGVDKFHRGQFSNLTEDGKRECHLVTTVGKFRAMWNFQQVNNSAHGCYKNQQGLRSCYCYKLVLKDESTINRRFIHDKFAVSNSPEAPLQAVATPAATPMNVTAINMSGRRSRYWEEMIPGAPWAYRLRMVLLSSFLVFLVFIFFFNR